MTDLKNRIRNVVTRSESVIYLFITVLLNLLFMFSLVLYIFTPLPLSIPTVLAVSVLAFFVVFMLLVTMSINYYPKSELLKTLLYSGLRRPYQIGQVFLMGLAGGTLLIGALSFSTGQLVPVFGGTVLSNILVAVVATTGALEISVYFYLFKYSALREDPEEMADEILERYHDGELDDFLEDEDIPEEMMEE